MMMIPVKSLCKEIVLFLGLSIGCALLVNALSPKGIALFGDWDPTQGVVTAKAKDMVIDHELEIDSVAQAKQIYDSGRAVFVDARSADAYAEAHIAGAVSLPVGRFDTAIETFMQHYPPQTYLVTYCSGRECDDSHRLAQFLMETGFFNVSIFIDGLPGWQQEGHPIAK